MFKLDKYANEINVQNNQKFELKLLYNNSYNI